jgi:hypothetical protein
MKAPSNPTPQCALPAAWALALLAVSMPALAQTPAPAAAAPASPDGAPVPLVYETAAREAEPVRQAAVCPIVLAPPQDQRQNKQAIGATFRGPLITGDPAPWLTDGLLQLKDFGYSVQKAGADAPPPGGLLVRTSLSRAYTWQVGFKIFGMIALKAEFVDANGVLQAKRYRAHGDKTNMWGAQGEYVTTLNYGLNNLLREMAVDLAALCKGQKVAEFTYAGPQAKAPGAK